jgi:hypothetical protein
VPSLKDALSYSVGFVKIKNRYKLFCACLVSFAA